jgi:hypothetical protein
MKKKFEHSKTDIAKIAEYIKNMLSALGMDRDTCIYFNGKRWTNITHWDSELGECIHDWVLEENIYPIDYCEYAPQDNIISISSEGELYDAMNYNFEFIDENALPNNSLYVEMGTSWFYYLCPSSGTWENWETTRKPGDYRKN